MIDGPIKNTPDSPHPWPSMEQLYKKYGYTPPDSKVEKKIFPFEWTKENMDRMSSTLARVQERTPDGSFGDERIKFPNGVFFYASSSKFSGDELKAHLTDEDAEIRKASLHFLSLPEYQDIFEAEGVNFWMMKHRIVVEKYRGQDIGSKLYQVAEGAFKEIANKTGLSQAIGIEAHQIPTLNFGLKNDFVPATPEDEERLRLVQSGDRSKVLVATVPGFDNDHIPRPGFVFSIKHLQEFLKGRYGDLNPEQIWAMDIEKIFPSGKYDFFDHAIAVQMVKVIPTEQAE